MTEPYRFDWHADPENSFRKWFLLNLITGINVANEYGDKSTKTFKRLSAKTDRFRDVELEVKIAGESVPVDYFFEVVQRVMEDRVARSVADTLAELPSMDYLREALVDAEREATVVLRDRLADAGIRVDDPYDD